jgi:HEAT repeat protein
MTENPDRIERTLELLLFAPIGVGAFLRDSAPSFVDMVVSRGRAEFDRRQEEVQQRLTSARSLGQVALAFGAPKLRQRAEQTVTDARRRAEELLGSHTADTSRPRADLPSSSPLTESAGPAPSTPRPSSPAPTPTPTPTPTESAAASREHYAGLYAETRAEPTNTSNGDLAGSAELPIPGYDALSASQVVERLLGLAPEELDAVHAYEASHRQRRTILGKIEQLAE